MLTSKEYIYMIKARPKGMSKLTKEQAAWMGICQEMLGLHDISIYPSLKDAPGNDPNNGGITIPDVTYLRGMIELQRGLDKQELIHNTLHEMFEVALAPMLLVVSTHFNVLGRDQQIGRELAEEQLNVVKEQFIERTVKGILDKIDPQAYINKRLDKGVNDGRQDPHAQAMGSASE